MFLYEIKRKRIWRLNTLFLSEETYVTRLTQHRKLWLEEFKGITDIRWNGNL